MRKLLKIIKWGMLIALMVVVLVFAETEQAKQLAQLDLEQINIQSSQDDKFLTDSIIWEYIQLQNFSYDGVILSECYLHNLEQTLLRHPAVKKAEVFANQQGLINIQLQPRKAIVRIKVADADYYLDEDGLEMPLSKVYTPRVIVVSGEVSEYHHSSIYIFIRKINRSEFWKSQITQLHFLDNEVVLIPRVGNHKIHFGMLVNTTEKLANLYELYKQVMPVKGWQTYSDINLKYNGQIICTKR